VGPDRPVIPRVQNMYIRKIMVKFEQNISADKAKSVMREYVDHTLATDVFKSVIIYFDVDPM
jgi:primosomal protein N' (replication factor Y)